MIYWRRMIGISLGLVAASSLWTVAQAYPAQSEGLEAPILVQVDDTEVDDTEVGKTEIGDTQVGDTQVDDTELGDSQVNDAQVSDSQIDELTATDALSETLVEITPPVSAADSADTTAVEASVAKVITPVPTEVLENLSQDQMNAIASIIVTTEASTSPSLIANLPTEVLTQLDALGVAQQVGRRRWLPTGLVRRLRLPQMVGSLIRQPRNTALGMLGNHIVVVNPVTGAVLGAVLSAL